MRILDADALLKMINSKKGMIGCTGLRNYINFMAKDDKDIVEVVRCKDCIHQFKVKCPFAYSRFPKDDDFCSYGERKTDG